MTNCIFIIFIQINLGFGRLAIQSLFGHVLISYNPEEKPTVNMYKLKHHWTDLQWSSSVQFSAYHTALHYTALH